MLEKQMKVFLDTHLKTKGKKAKSLLVKWGKTFALLESFIEKQGDFFNRIFKLEKVSDEEKVKFIEAIIASTVVAYMERLVPDDRAREEVYNLIDVLTKRKSTYDDSGMYA